MVQGGGASDQIFSRGFKYIFGTLPAASDYFGSTIETMAKLEPEPKTVALLYADDAFDVSVAKGTRRLLQEPASNIVLDERYSSNASDFTSLLSQIKSKNADVVLVAGHETEILNFIRQAKSLVVSPKLYSFTVGVPSADFRQALGEDADYAFGMTSWLPSATQKTAGSAMPRSSPQDYKAKVRLRPGLSRCLRRGRRRGLRPGDRGGRFADPQEGARRACEGQLRQPVRPHQLQREGPDRPAANGDPGPERQGRADLRRQGFRRQAEYPMPLGQALDASRSVASPRRHDLRRRLPRNLRGLEVTARSTRS